MYSWERLEREREWYDVMLACEQGHVITSTAKSNPEDMKKRCPKCGAKTLTQCPHCQAEIQGYHHIPGVYYPGPSAPPTYCHECGEPFPWATLVEGVRDTYGLHPSIYEKCYELYKNKTYAEAVEKSFKVVKDRLRSLTTFEAGSDAFGKGNLYIRGAAAPNVDKDFNQAVKFLTMAIDQFRNEKSHTSDAKIEDPIRAYQYLMLSSLAMGLLEDTEIRP
jgi:uncharacterized protein (TIGR02391 family)